MASHVITIIMPMRDLILHVIILVSPLIYGHFFWMPAFFFIAHTGCGPKMAHLWFTFYEVLTFPITCAVHYIIKKHTKIYIQNSLKCYFHTALYYIILIQCCIVSPGILFSSTTDNSVRNHCQRVCLTLLNYTPGLVTAQHLLTSDPAVSSLDSWFWPHRASHPLAAEQLSSALHITASIWNFSWLCCGGG